MSFYLQQTIYCFHILKSYCVHLASSLRWDTSTTRCSRSVVGAYFLVITMRAQVKIALQDALKMSFRFLKISYPSRNMSFVGFLTKGNRPLMNARTHARAVHVYIHSLMACAPFIIGCMSQLEFIARTLLRIVIFIQNLKVFE